MPPSASPARPELPAWRIPASKSRYPSSADLAAWPIRVPLRPGEQLAAWWVRLADRYGITASTLLRIVCSRVASYRRAGVRRRLARPSRAITHFTGVGDAERKIASEGEDRLAHDRARLQLTYGVATAMRPRQGSRYCPRCLARNHPWHVSWTDPAVLVCITHGVLLESECPKCGGQPFSGLTWATTLHAVHECTAPAPVTHHHRRRYATCGHDLREAPVQPAPPTLTAATELLLIDGATEEQAGFTVAGRPATVQETRDALLLLAFTELGHV